MGRWRNRGAALVLVLVMLPWCRLDDWSVFGMEIETSAASYVLMEAVTGEILAQKDAHVQRPMASTTKIMTTLLCLESGDLDTEFVVDADAIQVEGSSMGLLPGDTVTKRTLCYGMLLPSGNDAAGAVAVKLAGSYEAFADQMNQKARSLGMTDTNFVTPSGLHTDAHYSTAYDMAILTVAALQNPDFREICSQSSAQVSFGNPPYDRWLQNSNKLLTMDDSIIGVKTGFTDEAGRCLVSASVRNGITLICVTLNDKDDWADHLALYDYGFAQLEPVDALAGQSWQLAVTGGMGSTVTAVAETTLTVGVAENAAPELTYQIETFPFLYAPVEAGQQVGTWTAMTQGRAVATGALVAEETVLAKAADEIRKTIPKRIWETIQAILRSIRRKLSGV